MSRPLIIYEEYRLHAICFTMRSVTVYFLAYFKPFEGTSINRLCHLIACFPIHLIADEITRRHGPSDPTKTTVRMDHNKKVSNPVMAVGKTILFRYYAFF